MDASRLRQLLHRVQRGTITVDAAIEKLRTLPYENLEYAKVDHHRPLRQGFPEVILCEGKTTAHIVGIATDLLKKGHPILATRADAKAARALKRVSPQAVYHRTGRVVVIHSSPPPRQGNILVITAGTADLPVAEEARITAETMGSAVQTLYDVGVAGVHRLLDHLDHLRRARVVIVIAGMDGVLPSVVGGLVDRPVIAVPTSQGYGAHFGGLAPLLTMLNACAGGIGVVNIDNGFGAACLAHRINVLPPGQKRTPS
ncbi:MAG: nickel pincer cofactor biosynthesis protein LarB [Nitrospirae bacterium]|nr:MAG: nickel pincer cofactor biosynthesis protein LarB [Nitrospirota bacterium]